MAVKAPSLPGPASEQSGNIIDADWQPLPSGCLMRLWHDLSEHVKPRVTFSLDSLSNERVWNPKRFF